MYTMIIYSMFKYRLWWVLGKRKFWVMLRGWRWLWSWRVVYSFRYSEMLCRYLIVRLLHYTPVEIVAGKYELLEWVAERYGIDRGLI